LWEKIIAIIERHQSFVLTSHINPDCDALGSELALAEYLETLGKRVVIINNDPVPATYRFLDGQHRIRRFTAKKYASLIQNAEVIIVLDASGGWDRLGPIGQTLGQTAAVKLCIDHHPDGADFADAAVIDTEAAATGELIYALIMAMGGSISTEMAQALYAAILTDTGSFRFPKTSPRTHHIAAALLVAGADPLYIYRRLYEQNSAGSVRLKGYIMASIQTAANGQIAYYSVGKDVLKHYGVKVSELDGVASLGQQIGGVRVSIFCVEISHDGVKISLRSDGSIAINQIASGYGGGGHPSAAGAMVQGKLEQIMVELVAKVTALVVGK
jgi:phosphoesterase RecJ-like protein